MSYRCILICCLSFGRNRWKVFLNISNRPLWNICITNENGYSPSVISTCHSFPHSWLITLFVTRLARVQSVEQELSEHMSSAPPPVVSGVRVTWSLVLCVCFVDRCLSFGSVSFGHCFLFFDLQILITLLVSSKSSNHYIFYYNMLQNNIFVLQKIQPFFMLIILMTMISVLS